MAIEKNPVSPSQGAFRLALPCASSSPSDAEPGGSPMPRKSSEVRIVTEPASVNGRKVRVATMALGSTWRNMITRSVAPRARLARTKSRLRARRNSARTTPTKPIQLNSSRTASSHQKFGSTTEATMIRM